MKFTIMKAIQQTGGILLMVLLFSATSFAGGMSSAGYIISTDVLSSGGGVVQSTNYKLQSTLGQSSPIGISGSTTYSNHAGFWPTANSVLKKSNILWLVLPAILSGAGE